MSSDNERTSEETRGGECQGYTDFTCRDLGLTPVIR